MLYESSKKKGERCPQIVHRGDRLLALSLYVCETHVSAHMALCVGSYKPFLCCLSQQP